ncbi:MAG: amidase [Gammaproteobacteria bacterium]|jgi:amidase|nr:amidase [Gammaproteobacteria bacterium]MBU0772217.1 amidase [Gammaproteobacteria bacterium]MBU0855280.1 amidase [Gammaproteobacteria bacterium]MBU1848344.1 amidase [Gammaproteobacteria bacterium]
MNRKLLVTALALFGNVAAFDALAQTAPTQFNLIEATVPQIQAAMQSRLLSSEQLVNMYLARVAAYDDAGPMLNSYLYVNPAAAAEANTLDALRFVPGREVGPLYGIPVLLKDIINTRDMPTTGGAVALKESIPLHDAFITKKLRAAGAIIIGKATLTEFANFVTSGMPAGYSSYGGYGFNPYNPVPLPGGDGRPLLSPSGSSAGSGIAAAANLSALTIGTETSGSILSPSNANGIVGIKPTVGLVSRDGIIPITADQDTAGPMTRSVTDAAILLGVIAGYDPDDPATEACLDADKCPADYTVFLNKAGLAGARIAVPPFPSNRTAIMEAAIQTMRDLGATVDTIPALASVGVSGILNYGQKRDVNAYFDKSVPDTFPIRSLADLIAFNEAHPDIALKYGQTSFIASQALDISEGSADTLKYIADRDLGFERSRGLINDALNGPDGIGGTEDDYDAIVYSGSGSAGTWARAGYPSIVVPGGFVESNGAQIPSGVSFAGRPFGEGRLIELGYAFEQATGARIPPASAPALPTDVVRLGDVNGDGWVDSTDVSLVTKRMNQPASGPYDKADVDHDGRITALDTRKLATLCSRARCATK